MVTIGAAKFKEQCFALLDKLKPEGLIITKHCSPVARATPDPRNPADLIGCLRHKVHVQGDIQSTGVNWVADAQP